MPSRKLLSFALVLLALAGPCRRRTFAEPLAINGPTTAAPYKLITLEPKNAPDGAAFVWDVSPEEKADAVELADGRIIFTGPPGEYTAKLRAIVVKDGKTSALTARLRVTIGGGGTKPPDGSPVPKGMGAAAIARLRVGNSGCTCSAIWPRRPDGKWDVFCASHCTGEPGTHGVMTLKDGRTFQLTVTARNTKPDISWFVTDDANAADMPYLLMATALPSPGTPVWQAGYGQTQPTVRKEGTFTSGPDSGGQLQFKILVDHGDSGGPIMRVDTDEVLASVCCTKSTGSRNDVWGGGFSAAASMRPHYLYVPPPEEAPSMDPPGCGEETRPPQCLILPGLDDLRRRRAA